MCQGTDFFNMFSFIKHTLRPFYVLGAVLNAEISRCIRHGPCLHGVHGLADRDAEANNIVQKGNIGIMMKVHIGYTRFLDERRKQCMPGRLGRASQRRQFPSCLYE